MNWNRPIRFLSGFPRTRLVLIRNAICCCLAVRNLAAPRVGEASQHAGVSGENVRMVKDEALAAIRQTLKMLEGPSSRSGSVCDGLVAAQNKDAKDLIRSVEEPNTRSAGENSCIEHSIVADVDAPVY